MSDRSNLPLKTTTSSNTMKLEVLKLNITNSKYHLYPYNRDTYGLIVLDSRLANKINKLLKYYPADYKIKEGEEPLFKFKASDLLLVSKKLGLKV